MTVEASQAVPGPGRWDRDNSHFPLPISRYLWELFAPAYLEGAPRGFERCGSLVGRLNLVRIQGRVYQRTRLVTDAEELARRQRAAVEAISTKLWRTDRAAWSTKRESFRRRLLELARQDPLDMSAAALHGHLLALRSIFHEGVIQHFIQQPASLFPVGDWVQRTCDLTDASASQVVALLQGSCSESSDFLRVINNIVAALRSAPEIKFLLRDSTMEPRIRLEKLRCLSAITASAFDAYLNEYADRIVTGFDVTDQTLRELPQFTLAVISARFDSLSDEPLSWTRASKAETGLRQRVPPEMLGEFDQGLAEARAAYGFHDTDIRITYLWPLGLIRRTLLAAAQCLAAVGALRKTNDVFQATPSEVDALLMGRDAPCAGELAGRADEWLSWSREETPPSFGEIEPSASFEGLHPACARMNSAIAFYIAQMEARNIPPTEPSWSLLVEGIPASPGCYEGWARVIRGPDDFRNLQQGDVLIARTTSPAYNILLPLVGAVVTDRGGALCHTAIIAREFGLPAVVGASQATARIPDGARVFVDGGRGFVAVRTG